MNIEDIIKLMQTAQETDFDTVELEQDELYMKLVRNQPPNIIQAAAPIAMPSAQPVEYAPVQQQAAPPPAPDTPAAEHSDGGTDAAGGTPGSVSISSPLVGIFHELAGGKAVKIGDKIKKDEVICMVEAMKLMNEITMPEDGEIVWVATKEGDTVEYGQTLFNYVPA